jgi:hypothetical protein
VLTGSCVDGPAVREIQGVRSFLFLLKMT